jgi:hypothetical protein
MIDRHLLRFSLLWDREQRGDYHPILSSDPLVSKLRGIVSSFALKKTLSNERITKSAQCKHGFSTIFMMPCAHQMYERRISNEPLTVSHFGVQHILPTEAIFGEGYGPVRRKNFNIRDACSILNLKPLPDEEVARVEAYVEGQLSLKEATTLITVLQPLLVPRKSNKRKRSSFEKRPAAGPKNFSARFAGLPLLSKRNAASEEQAHPKDVGARSAAGSAADSSEFADLSEGIADATGSVGDIKQRPGATTDTSENEVSEGLHKENEETLPGEPRKRKRKRNLNEDRELVALAVALGKRRRFNEQKNK